MNKNLMNFLKKHYGDEFQVTDCSKTGNDYFITLDFGDEEIVELVVRERDGYNGNFRITMTR